MGSTCRRDSIDYDGGGILVFRLFGLLMTNPLISLFVGLHTGCNLTLVVEYQ